MPLGLEDLRSSLAASIRRLGSIIRPSAPITHPSQSQDPDTGPWCHKNPTSHASLTICEHPSKINRYTLRYGSIPSDPPQKFTSAGLISN
ncbi:hypothetical protein PtA15_8A52 [Puccinia triticina]|uniref:Uncharacterized protein n=1 Tax=Puccinia triticina TaxID=208348 RepID=A0ABY7CPH6_9BASI|nr:uncharacterized protein PtA15_8A52 [Puccinia triticina]WAQ87151.1 hypothetical protein PtA15_8A52 [Puccinia triticina]